MPGLRLAASKGKKTAPKKTAPNDWLGSAQVQEEEELDEDPLFMDDTPSAAPVAIHAPVPVEPNPDMAQMMQMMKQQQEVIASLQGQVNANTANRLQQTPQGTLALTPYQVRVSCDFCVKTIT